MADALTIWLYGQAVARVERKRNRKIRLTYSEAALQTYNPGFPLLSLELPVSDRDYPNAVTRSFLEGLLPEGDALREIAEQLDLRSTDTYDLISALGRDCAGALIIQPEGEPAPPIPSVHTAEPLTDGELAALVDNLRSAPLGIDRRVRISLGGAQEKLLLTRISAEAWGRPVDGTPSTHILKPQIRGLDHTVENEAFCMRIAAYIGLRVAPIEITHVRSRPLLVIRRYDRLVNDDGTVERIHQEDFCQALGFPPASKYEEDNGPSLRRIAGIIQAVADESDLEDFLRTVTLNVVLGNGDAHGKNYSLLHGRSGRMRLAPLYDLLCTLVYRQDRLALYIDNVRKLERVTRARIVNEASSWGMSRRLADDLVDDFLQRIPPAMERAAEETIGLPSTILECVNQQLRRLMNTI